MDTGFETRGVSSAKQVARLSSSHHLLSNFQNETNTKKIHQTM